MRTGEIKKLVLIALALSSPAAFAVDCQLDISEVPVIIQAKASDMLAAKGYQPVFAKEKAGLFLHITRGPLEKTMRADSYESEIIVSVAELQDSSIATHALSPEKAIRCDQATEADWSEEQNRAILKAISALDKCPR